MIHIEQGQSVADNENLKVVTATGDYSDNALIEFCNVDTPEVVAGSFAAQYIKYGGMVYRFNGAKELGEEILKIDTESTHTAASYVRMTNELLSQMDEGSLEPTSLDQVISDEQAKTEGQMESPVEEVPAEEETPVEETPVEEDVPAVEEEVPVEETPAEVPVEEPPVEEVPVEETPVVETPVDPVVPEVVPEDVVVPDVIPVEEVPLDQPVSMLTKKRSRKLV